MRFSRGPTPVASFRICMTMLAAAQAAGVAVDDWVMGFHDAAHSGTSAEVVRPPLTLGWTWSSTLSADASSATNYFLPIFSGGKLYLQGGRNACRVFCLDQSGQQIWTYSSYHSDIANMFRSSFLNYPAAANGRILFGSIDADTSLDAVIGGIDPDKPGSECTGVFATTSGTLEGAYPFGGVAVLGDRAYVQGLGTDSYYYETFLVRDPLDWHQARHVIPFSRFAYDDNGIHSDLSMRVPCAANGAVFENRNGQVRAHDAASGAQWWLWTTTGNWGASPAVAGGTLVVFNQGGSDLDPSRLGSLTALDVSRVAAGVAPVIWARSMRGAYSPIISGGIVYVGSSDGSLYALNAADGSRKWSFATGAPFTGCQIPAISGGLMYLPSADGNLYVLNLVDGTEVPGSRYSGDATRPLGPVIIGGGRIYTSDVQGTFYAFVSADTPPLDPPTAATSGTLLSSSARVADLNGPASLFTYNTSYATQRHVVSMSDGAVIAVYFKDDDIVAHVSVDQCATWTAPSVIGHVGLRFISSDFGSSVWKDAGDSLYVVTVEATRDYYAALTVYKFTYALGQVQLAAGFPRYPDGAGSTFGGDCAGIVRETGGRLWIAGYSNGYVRARYSDDDGATWSAAMTLGSFLNGVPALFITGDGHPACILSMGSSGGPGWTTWNGTSWSAVTALEPTDSSFQHGSGDFSVVTTDDGSIHVAWNTYGFKYIRYDGVQWSPASEIAVSGAHPSLTTDGRNVWCFYTDHDGDIAFKKRDPVGGWPDAATKVTVDGHARYETANFLATTPARSGNGRIPVAWTHAAGQNCQVRATMVDLGATGTTTGSSSTGTSTTGTSTTTATGTTTGSNSGGTASESGSPKTSCGMGSGLAAMLALLATATARLLAVRLRFIQKCA